MPRVQNRTRTPRVRENPHPVALEASAEERDSRGLTSITAYSRLAGWSANWRGRVGCVACCQTYFWATKLSVIFCCSESSRQMNSGRNKTQ